MQSEKICIESGKEWASGKGAFLRLTDGSRVAVFANTPGYEKLEPGAEVHVTWGRKWSTDNGDFDVIASISDMPIEPVQVDKSGDMFRYATVAGAEQSSEAWNIKVKGWMTQSQDDCEESDFTFHKDLNRGIAMPMRQMRAHILAETKGMYYMSMRGYTAPVKACLHCGKKLTHPVSLLYGIGPVCGEHFHARPAGVDMEAFYKSLQESLPQVTWEGWVAKSAIKEMARAI